MTHLKDVNMSYVRHFIRAWAIAGVLIVHSVFPNIWQHKASDMINKR
jgi:hypothetical protein